MSFPECQMQFLEDTLFLTILCLSQWSEEWESPESPDTVHISKTKVRPD